jgi:homoserine O-acetyltransferase
MQLRSLLAPLALWLAGGHAYAAPAAMPGALPAAPAPGALAVEPHDLVVDYTFRSGEHLADVRMHYTTLGTPRRNAANQITNAVLMLHWTSTSGAAMQTPEYASALFAPGKPLDPAKYFVIFIDNVGHGGSSKPSDGLHARFPHYGYRDMVALQHAVVHSLGIARLHAIVGTSMGGMHAWLWAETYPDEVEGIMPVVSLPVKIAGRNLLWRRIVEQAIRSDPEWQGGEYQHPPRGWLTAFPMFRMMLDGVPHMQAELTDREAADKYIADAEHLAAAVDANDVLYSLESSLDYDPEPELAKIHAKALVLNFDDDEFNPVALHTLEALTPRLPTARVVIQRGSPRSFGHSTQGHPSLWADHVGEFMRLLEHPAVPRRVQG